MVKAVSEGVEILVQTSYLDSHSSPQEKQFFFMYEINIVNQNDFPIRVLRRHWNIFDSIGDYREVDGDGVVGETPYIEPGKRFVYNSGCNLSTEIGKMSGFYIVRNEITMQEFTVTIPEFSLFAPAKLN